MQNIKPGCTLQVLYFYSIPFFRKRFFSLGQLRNNDRRDYEQNTDKGGNISVSPQIITLIIVLAICVAAFILLYFQGKRNMKKRDEQQAAIDQAAQWVNMLIIDKKKLRMKESGLPQMVIDQTPKMMRGSKLPIIKAKVGPQIVSLICDEKIFESVPVKKEVKAVVSGIYVLDVKGLHGKTEAAPEKKKGFFKRMIASAQEKAGAKPVK